MLCGDFFFHFEGGGVGASRLLSDCYNLREGGGGVAGLPNEGGLLHEKCSFSDVFIF
jgi:hypothetical protein